MRSTSPLSLFSSKAVQEARANELKHNYVPEFDGLRAIAVTLVIAYHLSQKLFPGGWLGVDIFFVLSGYLITKILSKEISRSGEINLPNFYMRRVLRLTPAFWAVMIFVLVFPDKRISLYENFNTVAVSFFYLMNWSRAYQFFPEGKLGHTWSLSMEEQFYLIWPICLLLIHNRKPLIWIIFGIVLVTTWRSYLVLQGCDPSRTYNGFDTHSDALLIGCALAFLPSFKQSYHLRSTLILIPFFVLSYMAVFARYDSPLTQSVGLSTASAMSAWAIWGVNDNNVIRRLLSSRPLVYTGKISYGWYLWHGPILQTAFEYLPNNRMANLAYVLVAYVIAAASYRWIEQPFLKLKTRFIPV